MRLESVKRSLPRAMTLLDQEVVTGIDKQPVNGPVAVEHEGLDGDGVGNTKHHGGPDQAVYLYGLDDYAWWAAAEGLTVHAGLFGENLTVSELASATVEVGDRYTVGAVELEVTGPRIPCRTLAGHVGDRRFAARFAGGRRPGAYVRVVTTGSLAAGDEVVVAHSGSGVTLLDCVDAYYDPTTPRAEVERLLAAPIAQRFRANLQPRLTGASRP